jgi:hypothetical protein
MGPTGPKGDTGPTGPQGKDCAKFGELSFTPFEMTKKDKGHVPFFEVYDCEPAIAIRGWSMRPSYETQEPISLYFEVPKDFDYRGTVAVDLHLLVQRQGNEPQRNKKLAIRLRSDFKGSAQDLGSVFADCIDKEIYIDEPLREFTGNKLKHYRVTIPLRASLIDPQDLVVLVLDRAACGIDSVEGEYRGDVYLAGASFRYTRKPIDKN